MNNSQNKNRKIIEPIEFFDTPRIQSPTEIAGMAGYIKYLNEQNYPSQTPRLSTAELKYLFTETENNDTACASMLYQIIGDDAIYSGQCYYIWNGYVWSMIGKEVFKHYVISILETRFNYVKSLQGYENLDYVESCCNNGKINSITAILQTYITIDPRILNNDTGLLCVRNGVIDFATRRLLPHYVYKKNYLTAMIDIEYEPGFRHPIFDNFIYSITDGDVGKIAYIQSVFGYAMLGSPREQLCFVFRGNGANGKTTLIDAVNAVLTHNYCCTVPKNIITHESNRDINASSSTIVQLNGKRIVFTSELRKTDKIAEARFKKLYESGEFGTVALMRVRNAVTINAVFEEHWFKEEPIGGGGAIRDLGCHNIDLACWILGEPDEINTMTGFTRGFAVDDTGVCNIKFKNGAVAMVDSSFSEPLSNNWYNFEMYGSKMSFIADTKTVTIIRNGDTGKIVSDKEVIDIENLPEGHKLPIAQWIDACTNGGELVCDVDAGVLVNRVLDAATVACREKRTVKI